MDRRYAVWFSAPNTSTAEIARDVGYGAAVLDIEHGAFDFAGPDHFVPFLRALGVEVIAKVLAPERGPIQQALDFGAFQELQDILELPTVYGIFVGPSDLWLRRNRGACSHTPSDVADFKTIAEAAKPAGKPWIFPAWHSSEKQFALEHNAAQIVLTMEHAARHDFPARPLAGC